MKMAKFGLRSFDKWAKDLEIRTPDYESFRLSLDWDDVDHFDAAYQFRKMVAILNDNWDNPAYEHLNTTKRPHSETGDEDDTYDERTAIAESVMKSLEINPAKKR